jgi:signal transduction histidine kinase
LPSKPTNKAGSPSAAAQTIGHVYLDVRRQMLYCLNVRAKQLHKDGVPFLPADLARQPLLTSGGELVKAADLPLLRAWKQARPEEATFTLKRDDGSIRHVIWTAAPLRSRSNEVVGVCATVNCVLPDPDWQALAGLAHDLRTPLQALKLLVGLLDTHRDLDPDLRQILERIRGASDRAMAIGMDLLEWTRGPIQGGRRAEASWFELEPFLLGLADEQMVAAQQKSLPMILEFAAIHTWEVYTDRVRLGRLLANLLSNAIRYTSGGSVKFQASWREDDATRKLAISVIDTGAGISDEEQESIFQPFERGSASRKEGDSGGSGGSGVGLAVVERLVEELALELDVYSEYGRGSTFHLLLPAELLRPSTQSQDSTITDRMDTLTSLEE